MGKVLSSITGERKRKEDERDRVAAEEGLALQKSQADKADKEKARAGAERAALAKDKRTRAGRRDRVSAQKGVGRAGISSRSGSAPGTRGGVSIQ